MQPFWLKSYPPKVPAEIDLKYQSIIQKFEKEIDLFKDKVAFENFRSSITFKEWDQKSTHFAAVLQNKYKLKKGDRIAIQIPNTLQYPIAVIGALKAGLVVVNINPLYTSRELKQILVDSKADAILIFSHSIRQLTPILPEVPVRHVILTHISDLFPWYKKAFYYFVLKYIKKLIPSTPPNVDSLTQCLKEGQNLVLTAPPIHSEDLAFLQYTGGTTGTPKGAMLSHLNILSNIEQCQAWIQPYLRLGKEVVVAPLPLYHIFALTINMFVTPLFGSKTILITNPRDIKSFLPIFKKSNPTLFVAVNALFKALLNVKEFKKCRFHSLRLCIGGGTSVETSVYEDWLQVTNIPIVEGYGLTEASPVVCCNNYYKPQKGFCGLPLPSTKVRIRDENNQDSKVGELQVNGPQVMMGYWNNEKESKEAFTSDGWLKTGDIATINPDGLVQILDRKKDMILTSGFNVYPNEIEDVLSMHPDIKNAAVVGVADKESFEVPSAFIVLKEGSSLTKEAIIQHCKQYLTGYKIPKYIHFRHQLPHSAVGKVLRKDLKKQNN